ncbi:MAG: HNH endonuclease signature motif containing protein [Anaeromyxobacteraceae bacterium]
MNAVEPIVAEATAVEPKAPEAGAPEAPQGPKRPLDGRPDLRAPRVDLPTLTHAALRRIEGTPDAVEEHERVLAWSAQMASAVDLAIGRLLSALAEGRWLAQLGFANVCDYAENILGMKRRTTQVAIQLARGLEKRPLLRAAVHAGQVTPRAALTVLRVAVGDAEAVWVERARRWTVRRLERAVRLALHDAAHAEGGASAGAGAGPEATQEEEVYVRLRVPLGAEDRKDLDVAFELAKELLETPLRTAHLEALAQEFLSEHPIDEADLVPLEAGPVAGAADPASGEATADAWPTHEQPTRREVSEYQSELVTDDWAKLEGYSEVAAPEVVPLEYATAEELDATLVGLCQERKAWDDVVGYCAAIVKGTQGHRRAGFVDFRHYAKERLGLAARTVEARAALELKVWDSPALQRARKEGLSYSKLALVAALPEAERATLAADAQRLTVVEVREAVAAKLDAQMCARRELDVWVPKGVADLVELAIRAARKARNDLKRELGACYGDLARHFNAVWGAEVVPPRTLSQKQRSLMSRCQAPGCSGRAKHGHHVWWRSRGGPDEPWNILPLCPFHHLVVVHGGIAEVFGRVPDTIEWIVKGRKWVGAEFGRDRSQRV